MNEDEARKLEKEIDRCIEEGRMPSVSIVRYMANREPTRLEVLLSRLKSKRREGEK